MSTISLLAALDGNDTKKGVKRPLTSVSVDVDLTSPNVPFTPQVMEAMRLRIVQLEEQLIARPAKRAKITLEPAPAKAVAGPGPSSSAMAASSKTEEKKIKMQRKKIFDRLKKECKSDGIKFQGSPKTIKFDEVFEQAEFDSLFAGKGFLFQPTPDNKPNSKVTIIHFKNDAHIESFFGDEFKGLKGNLWSRGGLQFGKSRKIRQCDVNIQNFEINYSQNNMKCSFKFDVRQAEDEYEGGYEMAWVRTF